MKAAVLYERTGTPQCVDFPEPVPQNDGEVLVSVKAVALKHVDKSRAKGMHYSTRGDIQQAKIIGSDGVCVLPDGTRVYAIGSGGMAAEKAVVEIGRMVPIPTGLDDLAAAALPNAVMGSAMGLKFRADIEPGDTVLINGGTGFTGRMAIQIAKHYGAGRIIATGRNEESLKALMTLGANEVIPLLRTNEEIIEDLRRIHQATPLNVIIDYLWGNSTELILSAIKGRGAFTPRTRLVSVGSMAGESIQLSAETLRSADIQLMGSGLGSWTKGQVTALFSEILPEMFQLAADGKLKADTVPVALKDIENIWAGDVNLAGGKRLVIRV